MEERLIEEIFERMVKEGFGEGTEHYETCKRALQFRNFSYRRSEELEPGATVDCSTLVSQAHWEGAAIGVPFVAENQRKATSGRTIDSPDDMVPADVLVKYPSLEASPDKTWNHVGLYLGRDAKDRRWLVESTSKTGVQLSTVEVFDPRGGIKRFTLTDQSFNSPESRTALSLTPLVPKFGRLGVRQYCKSREERVVHRGLDLYVPAGTPVYATMEGVVSTVRDPLEDAGGIEVTGPGVAVRFLMLKGVVVRANSTVRVGDLLGYVAPPSEKSGVVYSLAKGNMSHLHLEVEVPTSSHEALRGQEVVIANSRYLNHLYLSKVGRLSLPLHF